MRAMSLVHLVVIVAVLVVWFVPAVKILRKAGYSGWWSLLLLVPVGNIVAIWIFAFARWPNLPQPA